MHRVKASRFNAAGTTISVIGSAPPRVVRYRLRNVHSRIAPCLVHMPGVKVGERNMKGRQVMVAPFDYVRAALVPTAESAEEVEARLDAAKRKAKGRFR